MRIGTPLSPTATRVLLLGSGELGKEVAIAFQRLGVEVVAVDRYPGAPAHQVAHRWHAIDMTDPVALSCLIEQEAPDLVIPRMGVAVATADDVVTARERATRAASLVRPSGTDDLAGVARPRVTRAGLATHGTLATHGVRGSARRGTEVG